MPRRLATPSGAARGSICADETRTGPANRPRPPGVLAPGSAHGAARRRPAACATSFAACRARR
jgi:hypothetical protein